ncbi:MAG: MFS transporter [Reyranella sp.]|uniref:MFS transporter n=1 Tax=Reyranella sp. TaxID=1929291 RepID=UPI003D121CF1
MVDKRRPLPGAWGITALVFLFMLINFADKAVVGLCAKPMMDELKMTTEQFGLLGSAFFLLFPVSAVVVGFVTNRIQARHALLAMAVLWSLIQFPMLSTVAFDVPLASRIVLGVAEGPAYAVAMHAIDKWYPNALRGLPTASSPRNRRSAQSLPCRF